MLYPQQMLSGRLLRVVNGRQKSNFNYKFLFFFLNNCKFNLELITIYLI